MSVPRPAQPVLAWLVAAAVLLAGVTGAVAAGPPATTGGWAQQSTPTPTPTPTAPVTPDPDNTVTRITLAPNGTGTWTLQIRTALTTQADVERYRLFQTAVRENTSAYLTPFRDRIRGVVANANRSTDREMTAHDFTLSTDVQEVPRRWGVVTYEFTWTNVAATRGDDLVVSDVFAGGFFLAEGDTLEIVAPEGYSVVAADPEPTARSEGTVTWVGRADFADGRPRVVVSPTADAPSTNGRVGSADSFGPLGGVVGVAGIGLVMAAAAFVIWRRRRVSNPAGGDAHGPMGTPGTERDEAVSSESTAETPTPATDSPVPGEEALVTDEDRVERLLERRGRMRQADVGEALDWSNSKTSRVLSRMADEGRVEKLRLGRENVIDLPDTPKGNEE